MTTLMVILVAKMIAIIVMVTIIPIVILTISVTLIVVNCNKDSDNGNNDNDINKSNNRKCIIQPMQYISHHLLLKYQTIRSGPATHGAVLFTFTLIVTNRLLMTVDKHLRTFIRNLIIQLLPNLIQASEKCNTKWRVNVYNPTHCSEGSNVTLRSDLCREPEWTNSYCGVFRYAVWVCSSIGELRLNP